MAYPAFLVRCSRGLVEDIPLELLSSRCPGRQLGHPKKCPVLCWLWM